MALTEKQEVLVKESWEILKQNVPEYSLRLFLRIMEVYPDAKNMFSFLRDSDEIPQNNPNLQAHAVKVFRLTCESVVQLRECGAVAIAGSTMKRLGSVHLKIGVTDRHFDVVREALLRTIEEAVGEKWSEEMEGAWGEGYDRLAAAILAEMKVSDEAAPAAN
ncbi:non-symbiotic hemoglobin 2 [Rhodamnia argentea]|uniref:Non-symbiotic hemoglobin 2 n=1 Tax=Rhodamnia argentea TaxID=178133 RepID=A0A8B8QK91_9MYRT|nr:non-symbiotic hemoglobin 2 [Rhodamnia argentea]